MHTGREREKLADVIADQFAFLERSLEIATRAGVKDAQIVLDPGFGFAKDAEENFALMARFEALHKLGYPLLAGTSRKRFIGHATGREAADRDIGTSATTALLRAANVLSRKGRARTKRTRARAIRTWRTIASGLSSTTGVLM